MTHPSPAFGPASLVARPESVWDSKSVSAGAGMLDSGLGLYADLGKDGDWSGLATGIDGFAAGLDMISLALNPLGELVKAGVGWLMEHVAFIREPLELLTGDHRAIAAISKTWSNIGSQLIDTARLYDSAISDIACWSGPAAEAYRKTAKDYVSCLGAVANHAENTSQGIAIAGIVVATERALVFDIIASFISRVITEAVLAAIAAPETFGGSVAALIASVTADASILASKLAKRLAALLKRMSEFADRFKDMSTATKEVAHVLRGRSSQIQGWADTVGKQAGQAKREAREFYGPAARSYSRWGEGKSGSTGGKVLGTLGNLAEDGRVKLGKEAAKATQDDLDLASGGGD